MKTRLPALVLSVVLLLAFSGCEKFEYSPFQTTTLFDLPSNLNAASIEKLKESEHTADDTVTIVYSGDSQRFYDKLHDLVKKVNTLPAVDLFILCGDLADFGIQQEYIWIYDELKHLRTPYISVIGNHDLIANKGKAFQKLFGENNFTFSYKGYKFLCHDTNGREYGFKGAVPDLPWLERELKDSLSQWFVGVSHVPPFNEDFDKKLEHPYKNLLASNRKFILSMHGHLHDKSDQFYYDDHVRYMTSNAVVKSEVILLKLIHGKIIKQMIVY